MLEVIMKARLIRTVFIIGSLLNLLRVGRCKMLQ
jgi:hypothetical protein